MSARDCEFCERDYCDTDCAFADTHGRLDGHGETCDPGEERKTAEQWRAIGAEMVAAWLDSIAEGPSLYASHCRALAADVRAGKWRAARSTGSPR